MLAGRFYFETTLVYDPLFAQKSSGRPFEVEARGDIQLSHRDLVDTLRRGRNELSAAEWKDCLLRSMASSLRR